MLSMPSKISPLKVFESKEKFTNGVLFQNKLILTKNEQALVCVDGVEKFKLSIGIHVDLTKMPILKILFA